jgi:D-alanyl-D-alanine carboxypeptidase/D-alanyl-D-alanine-endopeptidase (penicillin-binding protein 4)
MPHAAKVRFALGLIAQLVICFAGRSSSSTLAAADERLSPETRKVIEDPQFKHAHWGILVADRSTGAVLDEREADKLFAPASTTKLYSVATALDALGADYRFETPVYRRGTVKSEGVLEGDIVLVAVGDLTMGGRSARADKIEYTKADHTYANPSGNAVLTAGDPLAGLNLLAQQVATAGIRHIRGQVIIDARAFGPANATGSGPSQLTPIMINDNLVDFTVTPAAKGQRAKVEWRPQSKVLQVDAQIETIAAGGESKIECRSAGDDRLVLRGKIAADRPQYVVVHEVSDAARWARTLLIESLSRAGIAVSASLYDANPEGLLPKQGDTHGLTRIAVLKSAPFSENATLILKVSHNLHASTLPLLLTARHGKRQLADGLHVEHDFLKRAGLDADSISFGGGAGGAPADFTTPRMTVALLRYMSTRRDFAAYEKALPILGVDGTLAEAVSAKSPVRGKVRAKTGTLLWENETNGRFLVTSKALAGYMTAKSGRELVFSFVVNGVQIGKPAQTQDIARILAHLCELVYQSH